MTTEEGSVEMHRQCTAPDLGGGFFDIRDHRDPGVVHQHVEATPAIHGFRDQPLPGGLIGNVLFKEVASNFLGQGFPRLHVYIREHHRGTLLGQQPGIRSP